MTNPSMIEVPFSEADLGIVQSALVESFAGYAGGFLPGFLNTDKTELERLSGIVKDCSARGMKLALSERDWRLIYEVINAVMYELGPEELETITGHELNEFLNACRTIYANALQPF
jgi:hypothetical protein